MRCRVLNRMPSCVAEESLRELVQRLDADLRQCLAIRTMLIEAANRELQAANTALESKVHAAVRGQGQVEPVEDQGAGRLR